jgi:photosystem II stability/assembly factor-like uncharacterized protein
MKRMARGVVVLAVLALALAAVCGSSPTANRTWISTGGPIGGLGYDIRMRPDNPDVLFVTDAYAGVCKSTDSGATWFPANNGLPATSGMSGDAIPAFSLTIDPNHPDTVWVGMQFTSGIFRSDDGGQAWRSMNTGHNGIQEHGLTVRGIAVEPGNSDVVYVTGEVSSGEWNGAQRLARGLDMVKGVVYKTTDGGRTWTRLWYGDNLTRYVWIHPEDHNLLYVSTGLFDRGAANGDPEKGVPGGVGILRSRDGGGTWEVLDERNGFRADELYFGSLSMHPQDPRILLAASGNDIYEVSGGVYRTENGGDTWTKVLDVRNMSAVEFSTSDPNVAYAGSRAGLFRSDDAGRTWTRIGEAQWGSPDVVAGFPIDIQCDPRDPDRLFVNNYGGGNLLSEDGGRTWAVSSKGCTGALMHAVAVAQADAEIIYAAARSGLFASEDGGENWVGLAYGPARSVEGLTIAADPFDPKHVIASLVDAGPAPLVSFDGGRTWEVTGTDLFFGETHLVDGIAIRFVFAPSTPGRVYALASHGMCGVGCPGRMGPGILASDNGGGTWRPSGLTGENVSALVVSPSHDGLLYAGTFSGKVARSDDAGSTWRWVSQDVSSGLALTSLAMDPADSQKLYAGLDGGAILLSQDGGATWRRSASGMPAEMTVTSLVADPTRAGTVYAGTIGGVYVSSDGGASWKVMGTGLTVRAVKDIALSADGRVLYAATYGAGVARIDL